MCDHPPLCPPTCDSHCLAFDRITRDFCSSFPAANSKWCSLHEGIQALSLKTYKRYTLAVDSFDSTLLSTNSFKTCEPSQLHSVSELARKKWILIKRVIDSRSSHHQQFYQGGDGNHNLYVTGLKTERSRLEELMRNCDSRAYESILAKANAEWVKSIPTSFICDEDSVTTPLTPPPTPPSSIKSLSTASARKKASRKSRKEIDSIDCCETEEVTIERTETELLVKLRNYLVLPNDLPASIRPETFLSLIHSLFRFVILRIPSLANLALSGNVLLNSICDFLNFLENREGDEIKELWNGLKFKSENSDGILGVGILCDCLMDVGRETMEEDSFIELLGGKVYKIPSSTMTAEKWLIFYHFIPCHGCSLSITNSYSSWMRNRKLAYLGLFPAWLTPGENQLELIMRLSQMILCGSNYSSCGSKVKNVGGKRGMKAVSVEEWERPWIYMKAPIDDPWTTAFLKKIESLPDRFTILARNGSTQEYITDSSSISPNQTACRCCPTMATFWTSKVRSGSSPCARRLAKWTTQTFFPPTTILDSFGKSTSESRFGYNFKKEIYEILILENLPHSTAKDWNSFGDSIAQELMQVTGFENHSEILQEERRIAIENGEMGNLPSQDVQVMKQGQKWNARFEERFSTRNLFREK